MPQRHQVSQRDTVAPAACPQPASRPACQMAKAVGQLAQCYLITPVPPDHTTLIPARCCSIGRTCMGVAVARRHHLRGGLRPGPGPAQQQLPCAVTASRVGAPRPPCAPFLCLGHGTGQNVPHRPGGESLATLDAAVVAAPRNMKQSGTASSILVGCENRVCPESNFCQQPPPLV